MPRCPCARASRSCCPRHRTAAHRTTGSLNTARGGPTATLLQNGMVLVTGGWNNGPIASAELYDPASRTWTTTGTLNTARGGHAATLLQNSLVLVAGGYNITGPLPSAELYDPERGRWTPLDSLNTIRSAHTATLLQNGKVVLVTGGYDSNFNALATAEVGLRQP
jgi:N-acetylneuraminic acid mutarotase